MTRRIAITGVAAVCFTALLVGIIAYVLVAANARRYEDRLLVNLAAHPATTLAVTNTTALAQIENPRGVVTRQSVALAKLGTLPTLGRGYSNQTVGGQQLRDYTRVAPSGRRISAAVSDAPARGTLANLRRGVLIAMGAGALLLSLALVWIVRRAMAPVRATATLADRIVSTGDLGARVPERAGDDELAQLTRSMNRMLDHLQSSDAALRRLVADASHELRSPVTTLRGNLELLTSGGLGSGVDRDEALADALSEAERLGRLVEELLALARADTLGPSERMDMTALVAEATDGTGATLAPVDATASAARVDGDPVALRAMIRNLAENADRYGGGGEITLSAEPSWVTVTVTDHGPGISAAEREAIFGRFTRGSAGEGRPGSGLGLAIVAATAQAHGGEVSVSDTPGGGATFAVRLPRALVS